MIKVRVSKQAYYPVSSIKIKNSVKNYLSAKGIKSKTHVSIALVGKDKMKRISNKYLKDNILHEVLSFTESEVDTKFVYPPGEGTFLGEVVVCYPECVRLAKKENKLIEQEVLFLIYHGLDHLMGVHHRE